ncbi:MAG: DoxX family protein [Candidatus Eremiobacteraeota bacterium]|nr:DoxX family protein [Candidatus Eremiobacteraeota bacterium]
MSSTLPSSATYGRWLAVVRILTGAIWLSHGVPKFTHSAEFMPSGPVDCNTIGLAQPVMANYICSGLLHTKGPYHQFMASVVLPNMTIFAELVRLGEVLVGLALILGVLTRIGALGGMLLTLNYIAARGTMFSTTTVQSLDFTLFVLCLISLALPTGRVFGVDGLWAHRRATAPAGSTVRAEFVPEPPLDRPTAPPSV